MLKLLEYSHEIYDTDSAISATGGFRSVFKSGSRLVRFNVYFSKHVASFGITCSVSSLLEIFFIM